MAERKIVAKTYFLFLSPANDEEYSLLVCLLSYTFNRSSATINADTFCGPSSSPGEQTVSIDFNGEIMLDPDADHISEPSIDRLWADRTTVGWKIAPAVPGAEDFSYKGHGFISVVNDTFDTGNANFSGTISVDGTYQQLLGIES